MSESPVRVLVLTPYLYGTAPGPRSSFELWERVLRDVGITFDYAEFETERLHQVVHEPGNIHLKAVEISRAYAAFLRKLKPLSDYDAVLVNREAALIGPAVIERWLVRSGKPLIYWIDDPLYVPYRSRSNGPLSHLKFFGKVKTLCRISTAVMTNSPSHTEFARRYNSRVWEIPSLVDGDVYNGWASSRREPNAPVCIGWSGSATSAINLQHIEAPLRILSERRDVEVRLIGARETDLASVKHTSQHWQAATEVADLRRFDIGLVPLIDHPWAPHKFYLKLVQYMALGIPPVASPMGCNSFVIDDGESGFLAAGDTEWVRTLTRLVNDPGLREAVGKQAAKVAHKRYTLQANAEEIIAAFRSALNA
jgi:L-malate glycosyltransferase